MPDTYLDQGCCESGVRILWQMLHDQVETLVEELLNLVLLDVLSELRAHKGVIYHILN